MYHYTLIQTSVDLQLRKADAKVDTFFTSTKYFTNFFLKKNYSILIYRKESLLVMPLNQGND